MPETQETIAEYVEKYAKPFVAPVADLTKSAFEAAEKMLDATKETVGRALNSLSDR